jgi:hypothetical protein
MGYPNATAFFEPIDLSGHQRPSWLEMGGGFGLAQDGDDRENIPSGRDRCSALSFE